MWEEASVNSRWKHIQFLNASQETLPGAVCKTGAQGLTKCHNSYLYCDILESTIPS